tara:strand:+ start:974 stop:2107 length:1134 start_codon:yes stop_codon:yes gene_type:complete
MSDFIKPTPSWLRRNVAEERQRERVPKQVVDRVKRELDKLKVNFKKKDIDGEYFWGWCPDGIEGEATTIDLPIIEVDIPKKPKTLETTRPKEYLGQDYKLQNKSCIIADKKTKRLLCVFIYHNELPAIKQAMKYCNQEFLDKWDEYYPEKKHAFYSGFLGGDWRISRERKKLEKKTGGERYDGKNWLEGVQRYLDGSKGHNMITYYRRDPKANKDYDFLFRLIYMYCAMYKIEQAIVPKPANFRLELAKQSEFIGCFTDSVPLDLCPSTSMGGSVDFASSSHADSSTRGTLESIFWLPPKNDKKIKQLFTNNLAERYFDINRHCCIFQVGTDLHGTAPTGAHGGYGFVNLSKKILVSDTKYIKTWFNAWRGYFKKYS